MNLLVPFSCWGPTTQTQIQPILPKDQSQMLYSISLLVNAPSMCIVFHDQMIKFSPNIKSTNEAVFNLIEEFKIQHLKKTYISFALPIVNSTVKLKARYTWVQKARYGTCFYPQIVMHFYSTHTLIIFFWKTHQTCRPCLQNPGP